MLKAYSLRHLRHEYNSTKSVEKLKEDSDYQINRCKIIVQAFCILDGRTLKSGPVGQFRLKGTKQPHNHIEIQLNECVGDQSQFP